MRQEDEKQSKANATDFFRSLESGVPNPSFDEVDLSFWNIGIKMTKAIRQQSIKRLIWLDVTLRWEYSIKGDLYKDWERRWKEYSPHLQERTYEDFIRWGIWQNIVSLIMKVSLRTARDYLKALRVLQSLENPQE